MSTYLRPIAVAVSLAIAVPPCVLWTAPALAQGKKPKTLREQLPENARAKWDSAIALYQRQNWDGAEADFMQAYELSKNPRVLFNVAICEKNRGRYSRAISFFRRELAEGQGNLTPQEEAEVKNAIAGLEKFVSDLTVEVNEPGAKVLVDGTEVGTTPLNKPISVEVGERRVTIQKAGFADATKTVTVSGGVAAKVSLTIEPITRMNVVKVSVVGPPNAVVKIDGKEVGPAPYTGRVAVTAEPHQFSAEAPGWVSATQSLVVREGEPMNLTLQLSQEQQKGKLIVTTRPEGATIEIDGKVVGASRFEGPVDAQTHQIVVKKQGYYTWSYDVDVPRGGERTLTASLNEDRNTSFVPWLIGTIVVLGASTAAVIFIATPNDEKPVQGSLPPNIVEHQAFRW
ncbi:MAG: PEGA domain-containing protein [Myxococcales bacterium]|nr:PEGA domain-containing protein [Myxococcales bacterium]